MNEHNHIFVNPARKVASVPSPISASEFSCLCSPGASAGEEGKGVVPDASWHEMKH